MMHVTNLLLCLVYLIIQLPAPGRPDQTPHSASLDSAAQFWNEASFLKSKEEGSKLTGEPCNPELLRPCRYPSDFCRLGPDPKCRPRNLGASKPRVRNQGSGLLRHTTTTTAKPGQKDPTSPTTTPDPTDFLQYPDEYQVPVSTYVQHQIRVNPRQQVSDVERDLNELTTLSPSPAVVGNLSWNGSPEPDKPVCILSHVINQEINGPKSTAEKEAWVHDHALEICNALNFQVCVEPDITKERDPNAIPGSNNEEQTFDGTKGVCRCIDSSYVVIGSKCYVGANHGSRSVCGPRIVNYPPVPGHEGGHPSLRPECVHNADCATSPEYFGFRCRCKLNAKLNRTSFTCSGGTPQISRLSGQTIFEVVRINIVIYFLRRLNTC